MTMMAGSGVALILLQFLLKPLLNAMLGGDSDTVAILTVKVTALILGVAVISSASKYSGEILRLRWREAITKHIHEVYFRGKAMYWLNSVDGRVENIDQRITSDIESMTLTASSMLWGTYISGGSGGTGAPTLPMLLTTLVLSAPAVAGAGLDSLSLSYAVLYAFFCFVVIVVFTMPVTPATFKVAEAMSHFRAQHIRVKEFCECVVFYDGQRNEERAADVFFVSFYLKMRRLFVRVFWLTAASGIAGGWIPPVSNLIFALFYIANPLKAPADGLDEGAGLALVGLLSSFMAALIAIPALFAAVGVIAGLTHRVGQLLEALDEIQAGAHRIQHNFRSMPKSDGLKVVNLTGRAPDGKKLYSNISFDVAVGKSVIIMGKSGCGKSSLLRLVAGLWPFDSGEIQRPAHAGRDGIFFVPQRPYIIEGTLRDQLLYPDTVATAAPDATRDEKLQALLQELDLGHLAGFPGGFDAVEPWKDMLSGGEAQRVGFIRLLYHRPTVAIMDESTSALDVPLEDKAMSLCSEAGICVLSVGHRPTLLKHHHYLLNLTGGGNYEFGAVSAEASAQAAHLAELEAGTRAGSVDVRLVSQRKVSKPAIPKQSEEDLADVKLDAAFARRFYALFKSGFPEFCSKPVAVLLFTIFLNFVTAFITLLVPELNGPVLGAMIAGIQPYNGTIAQWNATHPAGDPVHASVSFSSAFWWALTAVMAVQLVIAVFTAGCKWLGKVVSLYWYDAIVRDCHAIYFENKTMYATNQITRELDNVDQRICQDALSFTGVAGSVAFGGDTATSIFQTFFTIVIAIYKLGAAGYWFVVGCSLGFSALLLGVCIYLVQPISSAMYKVNKQEGSFRFHHARAREYSESIAFYNGVDREKEEADGLWGQLYDVYRRLLRVELPQRIVSSIATVGGGIVGFLFYYASLQLDDDPNPPVLNDVLFVVGTTSTMMGSLMLINDYLTTIAEIGGYAHRVAQLLDTMFVSLREYRRFDVEQRIQDGTYVAVKDVTVRSPSGALLFADMTFEIHAAEPLIIMGPSGAGKSSLLRVLGGLWPFEKGFIRRPLLVGHQGSFFVPQRPYITAGTLREQLLYPHLPAQQMVDDIELIDLLREVEMEYLVRRKGGLEAVEDWSDALSGGEQQRLGFARLLYHRPKFAFMDESTSALDEPLEARCMYLCQQAGITTISVGHRPTLIKFHSRVLRLDGAGSFTLEPVADYVPPERRGPDHPGAVQGRRSSIEAVVAASGSGVGAASATRE